ncbi:hypothetical protein [Dactylosporangium sp. NBC_01737]|uniref:hypothetical protein n=1 Tax=Dactylosporangium sp. NBC_01737 TaxID=2975959 RepID=UPI002E15F824
MAADGMTVVVHSRSSREATKLYLRAAEHGHDKALYDLGLLLDQPASTPGPRRLAAGQRRRLRRRPRRPRRAAPRVARARRTAARAPGRPAVP